MRPRVLSWLFLALFFLEFLSPGFQAEMLYWLSFAFLFSGLLGRTCKRRTANKRIFWIRLSFFTGALLYLLLLTIHLYQLGDLAWAAPTESSRSLLRGWFLCGLGVIALSSPGFIRFFSNLQTNPARFIAIIYGASAFLCSLLLILPWSLSEGQNLSFLDSLFISVSAITGAGLVVVNIAETFSLFGQSVILIFIQAGGIGIITFSGLLLLFIGKELGLREKVMQDESERLFFSGNIRQLVAAVAVVLVIFEFIGFLFLFPWMQGMFESNWEAAFHSLFQSVSAFCNAGLSSLPKGMVHARLFPLPLFVVSSIVFVGMLGLPVILDLGRFLRPSEHYRKLRAYTQMELILAAGFLLLGFLSIFAVEIANPLYESTGDALLQSFFQSAMRNAGFNSIPIEQMGLPAIFILISLMFVGGAPMSTAGGLKTATVGVLLIFVFNFLKGRKEASFAGRRLNPLLLMKAASVIVMYFGLLFIGFLALILTQTGEPIVILFEAVSALSICGLSMGITPDLDSFGKIVVIALMFIGRIGILTAVYVLTRDYKPERYRYPQGEFYVG